MIGDLILILLQIPLSIILAFLTGLTNFYSSIVPDGVYTSIQTLISYLGYFSGIFPVDTLVLCINFLINFFLAFYTVKIILYIWNLVPYLSTNNTQNLPSNNVLDLRSSENTRNTIDLRKGMKISKGVVDMKDIR